MICGWTACGATRKQGPDSAYRWQLVGNLKFTGRQWIDFVSYCSSFPVGKRLFVCRMYRDQCAEEFQMIDARLAQVLDLIAEAAHRTARLRCAAPEVCEVGGAL